MVYQDAAAKALEALGDPTRRAVFEVLAIGPHPVWEIASGLPVSRPAVSQHLRVLKEAGLVRDRRDGTRRVYSVDPSGLAALRDYLERYWDSALDAFERAAAEETAEETAEEKEGDER
jgi:DNA-binding transcriptional ArsR family regulator